MPHSESGGARFRRVNTTFKFDESGRVASLAEIYEAVGSLPGVKLELTWLGTPDMEPVGPPRLTMPARHIPAPIPRAAQADFHLPLPPREPPATELPPRDKPDRWRRPISRPGSVMQQVLDVFEAHPEENISVQQLREVFRDREGAELSNACSSLKRRGFIERIGFADYRLSSGQADHAADPEPGDE